MLLSARLRHVAGTVWSTKRYLNMSLLKDIEMVEKEVAWQLRTPPLEEGFGCIEINIYLRTNFIGTL